MEIKKQSRIRKTPFREPMRATIVMEREIVSRLKRKAIDMDTTASEIVRSIVIAWLEQEDGQHEQK